MHFANQTTFQLWLLLLICVSWVIASEEKTARPVDSVKPNAEDAVQEDHKYRRLLKAESSSDSGSASDDKDEKNDETKKIGKYNIGPVENAVEKASEKAAEKAAEKSFDSSSDNSDSETGNAAGGNDDGKSTQGIKREDYEPEESHSLHGRQKDSSDGSGSDKRRRKRAAEFYRPILPNAALKE